ncbi:uncharacterized protein LOC117785758, partial [Drosophila innubila]|uniref:uncharacterized protein LOC117785758 n=1 Tax=Drosophila innubila TaxID=198719 RepID=UPI00148C7E86
MLLLFVYLVLNLILNQVQTASNQPSLRSKFTKISVDSDADIISNLTGWLSSDATLCLDVYVKRIITTARTTITVKYKVEDSENYLTLLNYDVDTCKTLKDLMQVGLTSIWFRNVSKYGNFSSSCPIKPGYYHMRNFQLESKSIPVYLRPGNYRIKVFNYNGKPNTNTKA